MSARKICIVTGSRAEYGLLSLLMNHVQSDADLTLQVIATGTHLSPEFGLTYQEIERDGFSIDAKVEMLLSSDSPTGIAKSLGLGTIGFADAFDRLRPDILVVLGDRFEILAAVQAALVARIPVAHIAGGDTTEGAFDESIRHSITKMSHLHFVTNEESARRVLQLGEDPEHVYTVGHVGIDRIRELKLLSKAELEQSLGFKFRKRNLLVTFHPATLDATTPEAQFRELLTALDRFGNETGLIFTKPNADTGGRRLGEMIDSYVESHTHAAVFTSLGQLRYFSAIAQADAVVGNSSSGLYEVPSFGKPTVNIGDRQKGRLQASSVINCRPKADDITRAVTEALNRDCSSTVNPFGDGNSSRRIAAILKQIPDVQGILKKKFFTVDGSR